MEEGGSWWERVEMSGIEWRMEESGLKYKKLEKRGCVEDGKRGKKSEDTRRKERERKIITK